MFLFFLLFSPPFAFLVVKDDAEGKGRGSKLRASMKKSWRNSFARLSSRSSTIDSDKKVLTDLAWLEIEDGAFVLKERAPGVSVEDIIEKTQGKLIVPDHVPEMVFA